MFIDIVYVKNIYRSPSIVLKDITEKHSKIDDVMHFGGIWLAWPKIIWIGNFFNFLFQFEWGFFNVWVLWYPHSA